MNRKQGMLSGSEGSILIISFFIISLLSLMGISASSVVKITSKINTFYHQNKETFYIAEAGIEHAREVLRSQKDKNFTISLHVAAGKNGIIEAERTKSDDVPVASGNFNNGSYKVFLLNDLEESFSSLVDTNNTVLLRSVAVSKEGEQYRFEVVIAKPLLPFSNGLPAPITLLGKGSSFIPGIRKKDLFSGNEEDSCGSISKPVFSVFDEKTADGINDAVLLFASKGYITDDIGGTVQKISEADIFETSRFSGTDLNAVDDLKNVLRKLARGADTKPASGSSSSMIDMGDRKIPQVIFSEGDFFLNSRGYGMLIVTGTLFVGPDTDYDGLIVLIGEGHMEVIQGGGGTITGGILFANTATPSLTDEQGLEEYSSDAKRLGPALIDLSMSNGLKIKNCTQAVINAISLIPLRRVSFCDETCIVMRD